MRKLKAKRFLSIIDTIACGSFAISTILSSLTTFGSNISPESDVELLLSSLVDILIFYLSVFESK